MNPILPLLPPHVRSILVLTKHRFIGDTVVAVPLLRATRCAFPDAHITLLTGPAAATVLQHCPYADQIMQHDPKTANRDFGGSMRLTYSMVRTMLMLRRTRRPDLCLVADRSFRAAVAAVISGGRVRSGFDSEGRGSLLTYPVPYDTERREAECHLDILRAVVPDCDGFYDSTPQLWITEAERKRGGEILAEQEAVWPLLVGIQPGASHTSKQWETERFAAVADALIAHGAGIVLLGAGAGERAASRRMYETMRRASVVDLTGMTTIRETMGILSHLSLFIGNDTGVNHIAAGLGVPTVALFGPTPAHKWGNIGERNIVIAAPSNDLSLLDTTSVITAARSLLLGKNSIAPLVALGSDR